MKKENIRRNILYGVIIIAIILGIIIIINISSNTNDLETQNQPNVIERKVEDILPEAPPTTQNPTDVEEVGVEGGDDAN